MDLALWMIRVLLSAFLATLIFVAFGVFLLVNNFSGKLFNAEFYNEILQEQNAYQRIYDEVLLDHEVRQLTRTWMGDIQVVSHAEVVELFERILPPDYLQAQVEENIRRAVDYLNYEVDTLELYFEMGPPLAAVKPVLFDYIDARIDELAAVEPDPGTNLQEQMAEAQSLTETLARDLASGRVPRAVPSLTTIPERFRSDLFELVLADLLGDRSLDERVRRELQGNAPELRREFVAGDTRGFLKRMARAAATPLMDDSIAQVKQDLDSRERLDLIKSLAERSDQGSGEALRGDIANTRHQLNRARTLGRWVSLAIVIGGTMVMGLIHLPSLTSALRWTGLTLLLTGLAWYRLGKVVESTLADRLAGLIDPEAAELYDAPPTAVELGSDILRSLGEQLADGIGDPALILVAVGAVLLAGSFFVFVVRPWFPAVR